MDGAKNHITSKAEKIILPLIILATTIILFANHDLFSFLTVKKIAGWDLLGNYSLTLVMSELLRNGLFSGWSNMWFAGFPAFEFYPPFFFILVNFTEFVSFGSLTLLETFKIVVLGNLLIMPLLIYYSMNRIGFNKLQSSFITVLGFNFMFLNGHFSMVHRTLNFGLVAQAMAINLMFLFLASLSGLEKRKVPVAGILLALTILTHPFVGLVSIIILLTYLSVHIYGDYERKYLLRTLSIAGIGTLLTSGFILNVLQNLDYINIFKMGTGSFWDLPIALVLLSTVAPVHYYLSDKDVKRVNILPFILFIITAGISLFGSMIVSQPMRFMIYALLFLMLASGVSLHRLYEYLFGKTQKITKIFLIVLLLSPFVISAANDTVYKEWRTDYCGTELANINKSMEFIGNNTQGRTLAEIGSGNDMWYLTEKIPLEVEKPVLNKVHVDSSISAPWTLFLNDRVFFGGVGNPTCQLCGIKISDESLMNGLERFNVEHIVGTSYPTRNFTQVQKFGEFKIYDTGLNNSYYTVSDHKPVLIISKVNNWKKLNKKIFKDEELSDINFVWKSEYTEKVERERFSNIFRMQEETIDQFYTRIKSEISVEQIQNDADVEDFNYTNDKINFHIDSDEPVPVLLKFSYYPKWEGENTDIYWTNPSLMLVYEKGDINLEYR